MPLEEDKWYTRPIFSVSNIEQSLYHYCKLLGFEQAWKYEENQLTLVTQVNRGEFELILAGNLDRIGAGRVFVSLCEGEMKKLVSEIKENNISTEHIHWGYPSIRIQDPDGNEMIFPQESGS